MKFRATLLAIAFLVIANPAVAQKQYDSGATDTEIKIGNVSPYTGVFSEYGVEGRAEAAYFQMINDGGGIHGRKLKFVTKDDGSNPRQTVELARQLIDEDGVLLLFSILGTEANLAIRAYANEKKVPQLFLQTSSAVFDDSTHYPWTMGYYATYRTEGLAYARYILQSKPEAKIAILYPNTDAGREYLAAIREGLGDKASRMIVREASYEHNDPGLVSQLTSLKNSGADVFINLAWGRFATLTIRGTYDIDWHPLQFIPNASLSVAAFLEPAGLDKASGIISNARSKGWWHATARSDPAVRDFLDWMSKYNPQASLRDQIYVAGYERAQTLVEVLRRCGDNLTRANVMKQAASLDLQLGMLRPGIRITTGPTDYQPIKQLFLVKFNGTEWVPLGQVIGP